VVSHHEHPAHEVLPYLLPWVRVLFLIRSITSTDWDDTTGRLVQPILRRALDMCRQIAREGWWNSTPAGAASAPRSPRCLWRQRTGSLPLANGTKRLVRPCLLVSDDGPYGELTHPSCFRPEAGACGRHRWTPGPK
jgi:hypothetical protein